MQRKSPALIAGSLAIPVTPLPPGEYTVFAWESVDGEAYLNPEFLKGYDGLGKTLRLGEGERGSVSLVVIPGADDPQ
jgi:hypothetical protein